MPVIEDLNRLFAQGVRRIRFTYDDGSVRDMQFDDDILRRQMNPVGTDVRTGEQLNPLHGSVSVPYALRSVEPIE